MSINEAAEKALRDYNLRTADPLTPEEGFVFKIGFTYGVEHGMDRAQSVIGEVLAEHKP